MGECVFPPIEHENNQLELIEFDAMLDGKTVKCAVSYEALRDHFEADYSDPLFAFMTGRSQIETLICKLIGEGRFEQDGSILITTKDF
jgi:hypothetical protein